MSPSQFLRLRNESNAILKNYWRTFNQNESNAILKNYWRTFNQNESNQYKGDFSRERSENSLKNLNDGQKLVRMFNMVLSKPKRDFGWNCWQNFQDYERFYLIFQNPREMLLTIFKTLLYNYTSMGKKIYTIRLCSLMNNLIWQTELINIHRKLQFHICITLCLQ